MALPNRRTHQRDDRPRSGTAATEPDWRTLYEIENPADVDAYVALHPVVVSILTEGPQAVFDAFDEKLSLRLRLEYDREDEPASEYLTVDFVTQRDANDAEMRLDRFDEDWWIDAMSRAARADATIVFLPRFA
ncbi:MAG: hypothetical protein U0893_15795 [Chloroflexota bacterium]